MTERPRVSVVVPAYNEGEDVLGVLDRLFESVRLPCEVLVVVDFPEDSTVAVASRRAVMSGYRETADGAIGAPVCFRGCRAWS